MNATGANTFVERETGSVKKRVFDLPLCDVVTCLCVTFVGRETASEFLRSRF